MRIFLLTWITIMSFLNDAYGQNCPAGIPSAGNPLCIPPDQETSPYHQAPNAVRRGPQWRITWGAIAMDSTTGDIGTSAGLISEAKANKEAIARCAAEGSRRCKVVYPFRNTCAAIAWPSKDGVVTTGQPIILGDVSTEKASQRAVSLCSLERAGGECKVIYAECTKPVLVQ
jgi:hypothetical protein